MQVYEMGTLIPKALQVDDDTKSLLGITPEHAMVHAGRGFRAAIKTPSIANNGTYRIRIAVGAKEAHLKPVSISGGQDMDIVITEGFTSTAGTAHTVVASNRKHSETSVVTLTKGVTQGTDGTEIDREYTGTGSGKGATLANGAEELYLKANTIYGMTITNNSTAATALIKMYWYEPH